jgi:hypothetical protein
MATRTAPAFTDPANQRLISLLLIDASGDLGSVPVYVPVTASAANIEAFAGFYAVASQASLYGIVDYQIRMGSKDTSNADTGSRDSIKDGINLLYRDLAAGVTFSPRVLAPVPETMQGNQDIPLLSSDELTNIITSLLTLKPSYDFESAQYTERRERKNNPRIIS